MRILVTNDDGIHAPGLKALERVAKSLSDDVWTVAPEVEQSATSHSLTTRRPLRLRNFGRRRYSVDGTPTDCVLVAVNKVLNGRRPDLVLSGFNHGGNLGEDVTYSGTVAAAMEGATLGIHSVALSQVRREGEPANFKPGEAHAARVIRKLLEMEWPRDLLMNVNFPASDTPQEIEEVRVVRQGRRDNAVGLIEGRDPGGRPYVWIGDFPGDTTEEKKTDLAAIADGAISVTPLHLDLTHHGQLRRMAKVFP
ncbi:MAG: 5'/3'-nucleotidase SurE [Rhodovibrionaceae bacterium]